MVKKVGDISDTADEKGTNVSLTDPVPDPVQAHARGFGHTLRDGVGCNADGHLVVAKQRVCGLGMANVGQDFAFLCRDAGSGV